MKTKITVRTQGIKGGNAKFENKGCVTVYASDRGQERTDLVIDIDSFTGAGISYKRRENNLINISFENKLLFTGSIDELVTKLKGEKVQTEKSAKIQRIIDILATWGRTNSVELKLKSSQDFWQKVLNGEIDLSTELEEE